MNGLNLSTLVKCDKVRYFNDYRRDKRGDGGETIYISCSRVKLEWCVGSY